MSTKTLPTAFYFDDDGVERPLALVEVDEAIGTFCRCTFPNGAVGWTTTDKIFVRATESRMRRFAVTLRHDDGEIVITTSARTPETAVRSVCRAERAPRRSAVDVREVSA